MCTCGKCVCGVNLKLIDRQVRESVMKFLMGLNESFAQVKVQILLMDPLPLINKVYSVFLIDSRKNAKGCWSWIWF